ncbi:hypothetical protein XELAEV_18009885mg [Xenopus laevis]|uniref:Uncharacterized protein n=1 Tax=Xenopus laevis TaxID=8355 RepID=A0A974I188_XENLA|nr:hypothetical protein XELAEV_18009885mg [Xenopus laevis]
MGGSGGNILNIYTVYLFRKHNIKCKTSQEGEDSCIQNKYVKKLNSASKRTFVHELDKIYLVWQNFWALFAVTM